MFRAMRGTFCNKWIEKKARNEKMRALRWYVKKWNKLEKYFFRDLTDDDRMLTEEIKKR